MTGRRGRRPGTGATTRSRPDLLVDLFTATAAAAPEAVAVIAGSRQLAYQELDTRSGRLANLLRGQGVKRESLVGVCLPRETDLVVALLAIWKAGAGYVPLEPRQPTSRRAWMLQDTGARIVLTQASMAEEFAGQAGVVPLAVDGCADQLDSLPAAVPAVELAPESVAYAVYTSGSTGVPKGVLVTHGGIANRVRWTVRRHGLDPGDRVLQRTALAFDAAAWEVFAPLISGGTVVLAPDRATHDPEALLATAAAHGVTVLQVVPSVLRLLVEAAGWEECTQLRLLFSAGEPLPAQLCRRLLARAKLAIWNTYGPTECAIDVTAHEYDPEQDAGPVPIGRPIDNTRVRVLGPDGELVPPGVPGELYAGGPGVAWGYLGRPDLTAERFVPDPYGPPGARLYRTGDLVRWRHDDTLEYLGRLDHQIKVDGVRVEPAEVESALAAHPAVSGAVVVGFRTEAGDGRLAAYVRGHGEPDPDSWRRFLHSRLPAALIPSVFVPVAEFPLTASGKVDRAALPPLPDAGPTGDADEPATLTPAARVVADAWAELLDIDADDIRPDHDFFALGGSSLLLNRLAGRLSTVTGRDIPVGSLFLAATVAAQAELVAPESAREQESARLTRVARDQPLPLSFGQQRLWLLDQLQPGSPEWVTPVFVPLPAGIGPDTVRRALRDLVERHEVLRTRYVTVGPDTRQVIDPPAPVELRVVETPTAAPVDLFRDELSRGFDLAGGPVFRAVLKQLPGQEQFLLLTVHHIACDGWSAVLLRRDLRELCAAIHAGRLPELPPLPVQYADFAAFQRAQFSDDVVAREVAYWRRALEGAPVLDLPTDRGRPTAHDPRGALEVFTVPAQLNEAVAEVGRRRGASRFVTLATAFCTLLARYSGQWDIPLGTTVAGRTMPEIEHTVGLFLNPIVLRSRLDRRMTFEAALAVVGTVVRSAFAHQDLPFERLVDELRPVRDLSRTPLYQVMFDMQDEGVTGAAPDDESHRAMREVWQVARLDLTLVLQQRVDGTLLGYFEYATALFDADTIARLARHFIHLLRSIVADPAVELGSLGLLSAAEQRELTAGSHRSAGAPDQVSPPRHGVSRVVEEQARRTPDAVAVVAASGSVTYRELETRANRLARYLRAAGVGAEDVVGVMLGRDVDLLVCHLAVWKSGGAYLPLDRKLPAERAGYMLADSGARLLITGAGAGVPDAFPGRVLVLDEERRAIDRYGPEPLPEAPGPDQLAYVIYTSGSTGHPKGVQVEHRALLNLLLATQQEVEFTGPDGGWLAVTPTTFDVAANELYVPLVSGGRVVLVGEAVVDEPAALVRLIEGHEVTHVGVSPLRWRLLLDAGLDRPSLVALMGGEPCPAELARELRGRVRRLFNEYGPTESTVAATGWDVPPDAESVLIGHPLANVRAYVLDAELRPVPAGVVGELHVGGANLARGYTGQPASTADWFRPDPYGPPGSRMYRSGDLCRRLATGELSFVGRADDQVKIRGHRVELGEIQTVLTGHPDVRAAAVLARYRAGSQQLLAYCVPEGEVLPDASQLAGHCRRFLPEYMIPARFIRLSTLPLTSHGKVDHAALPVPEPVEPDEQFVHPRNPLERQIAEIWEDVLGVPASVTANFFVLGGNSLLATRVVARVQQVFDVVLPVRAVFERPTVAGIAGAVEELVRAEVSLLTEAELVEAHREASGRLEPGRARARPDGGEGTR